MESTPVESGSSFGITSNVLSVLGMFELTSKRSQRVRAAF